MCKWRYCYFIECSHAEFIRLSYCDKAQELGLPVKHDRYRGGSQDPPGDQGKSNDKKPSSDPGPSSDDRSSAFTKGGRRPPKKSSGGGQQRSSSIPSMSTTAPSEAALASAWAQVTPAPGEGQMDIVSRIPRSISDVDIIGSADHVARREYHQHASPTAPSSTTAEYSRLNIDIPLDPYSDFSMKLTHEDDEARARARSLSDTTAVQTESDTETETVRELSGHHGMADPLEQQSSFSSPFSVGRPELEPPIELSPTSRTKYGSTISKTTSKKMLKLAESAAGDTVDSQHSSQRKPIPRVWAGPCLATEQRAKERERKKITQEDATATGSRKSIRTARVSIDGGKAHAHETTSFLTKEAVEAVESDMIGPHRHTNSSRLRQSASKASIKSPSGSSPLRGSPGNNSTIQITVSPSRSHRSSIPNLDGTSHSGSADRHADSRRHSRAPSTISSVGGFVTARQSPVSSASEHSCYLNLGEGDEDDAPVLELANRDEMTQGTKDGSKPHTRGKSEPHAKVSPATRPSAPALSLRIPHYHSSTCSTDRKLHSAGSAPSSASGTPTSPTRSSRIPRVDSSAKDEHERPPGTLRRTKSAKALQTKPVAGDGEGEGRDARAKDEPTLPQAPAHKQAVSREDAPAQPSEGMYAVDTAEACAIPLPATPAPAMFRHVRTLNDQGSTPILASLSSKRVARAEFLTLTDDSHTKEPAPTPSSTNVSPAQAPPAIASIEAYLGNKLPQAALEGAELITPMEPLETNSGAATQDATTGVVETSIGLHAAVIAASLRSDKQEEDQTASTSDDAAIIKQTPEKDDPALHDSAIVYSTKKSDVSGPGPNEQTTGQASSIPSSSDTMADTAAVDDMASRTENETTKTVAAEASTPTAEKPAPSLRADAAEFVPGGAPHPQPPQPHVPTEEEWAQILPPFDPYGLDPYGQPLYHLMYPVAVGPGTAYDFSAYRPYHTSPKRGKKKHYSPKRNRGSRSDNNNDMTGSPMRTQRMMEGPQGVGDAGSPFEQPKVDRKGKGKAKDAATPQLATTALAASAGISPEELEALRAANAREDPKTTPDKAAFVDQMEAMTKQAAAFRRSQGAAGRGPRPTSWASMSMSQHPSESEPLPVPEAQSQSLRGQRDERAFDAVHIMPLPANIASASNVLASVPVPNDMPRNMPYTHTTLPVPGPAHHSRHQTHYIPQPTLPRHQHHSHHLPPRNPLYPFTPGPSSHPHHETTRPERYNRRNRHFAPPAGVPLDENDFPSPVAPPGPRPADAEPQPQPQPKAEPQTKRSKDYVGYSTIDNEPKCGEMDIVEACEFGVVCGDCVAKQAQH